MMFFFSEKNCQLVGIFILCIHLYIFFPLLCCLKIINKMSNKSIYRVRVLHSYPLIGESYYDNLTWDEAVTKFSFIVAACLEFPELSIRCVNIIKGKRKSIKMFQNHE